MEYGAEVWVPEALLAGGREVGGEERVAFLRRVLRVRGSAPRLVMMAELARWPLRCRWRKLVARYWQRLHNLPDERLVKRAFLDNLELAAEQRAAVGDAAPCWASRSAAVAHRFLHSVGIDALEPVLLLARDLPARVERVLQRRHLEALEAGGPKVAAYVALVRGGDTSLTGYKLKHGSYLYKERLAQRCALMWFRTGCVWRWGDGPACRAPSARASSAAAALWRMRRTRCSTARATPRSALLCPTRRCSLVRPPRPWRRSWRRTRARWRRSWRSAARCARIGWGAWRPLEPLEVR